MTTMCLIFVAFVGGGAGGLDVMAVPLPLQPMREHVKSKKTKIPARTRVTVTSEKGG